VPLNRATPQRKYHNATGPFESKRLTFERKFLYVYMTLARLGLKGRVIGRGQRLGLGLSND